MDTFGFGSDTDKKIVEIDNILDDKSGQDISSPKLSVVDSIGIELLSNNSDNNAKKEELNLLSNLDSSNDFNSTPPPTNQPIDDDMLNKQKESTANDFTPIHRMDPNEIKNEKIDYIYKFKKLNEQGIKTTMNYNMNSNLEDMRNEYLKLKKQREIDNSVKFQRKIMMAFVTGLEFLNNKVDPFQVQLDGWSESVNENIFDYDEIFEELHMKYGGDTEVAPEIRLIFALGGRAFMFHLQNTMFKSSMPGMDDILRQNPELMKQFASAAVGSMNPGKTSMPSYPTPSNAPRSVPRRASPQNSVSSSPRRPDMNGPDGIDNLIKTMNLDTKGIPDLDNISIISGDSDRKSGITLNL